jgi:hypothetical protein
MDTQSRNQEGVVRTPAAAAAEIARLLTEIEERKSVVVDLEMRIGTLQREVEAFEARYFVAVGALLAQLERLQIQIEKCYQRTDEIEEYGWRAMRKHVEEDAQRTFREKQAAAEEYERRARAGGNGRYAVPRLSSDEQKEMKDLYRRLAKAFHPDLAQNESDRENGARLMAEINDAYARGDVAHLRLIAEREQPFAADANEILSQRIERLTRQRAVLDETIARLQEQLRRLENSEFALLKREAAASGRDLLSEIAAKLKGRVHKKEQELHWAQQEWEEAMAEASRRRRRVIFRD